MDTRDALIHVLTEEATRLSHENQELRELRKTLNLIMRDMEECHEFGIAPCCVCDRQTFYWIEDDSDLRVNCIYCCGDCGVQIYCGTCRVETFGEDPDPQFCHVHRDEYTDEN